MSTKIAVNIPVKDLAESGRFFAGLGFPSTSSSQTKYGGARHQRRHLPAAGSGAVLQDDHEERDPRRHLERGHFCSCKSTAANASTN
jgi:hypothetical protein